MDPYLEQHWGDVHSRFMVYACDQVNDQLPDSLQARVEESLSVDDVDRWRTVYPDVRVVEEPRGGVAVASKSGLVADEPTYIPFPDEKPTQRHIEIIDRNSGNRVVTVIELLSPSNKSAEKGRRDYRIKQEEYCAAGVNLVEIDLLREGDFILSVPEKLIGWDLERTYVVCVRRAGSTRGAELYCASIRRPLPAIRIPLRPTDADVVLPLQPLMEECYRRGRYGTIDYRRPPSPALHPEDEQWADRLLREQGRR